MIVDAHNHPDWHGHDLTKYLANMDKYGIDVTWLLSWECPADEFGSECYRGIPELGLGTGPIPFGRCVSYIERAPERFVLGYAPDPRRPEAIDILSAAVDTFGVRIYGELKVRVPYDTPDCLDMFRFCGTKGLPVIVHIDYPLYAEHRYPRAHYWYGGGIEAFGRAVRACPGTTFLGHGPGFWAHISADGLHDKECYPSGPVVRDGEVTKLLRECPNLYCDLSAGSGCNALNRDVEHAVDFLTEFQDRILYARDYFDNVHQEALNSFGLPDKILQKIYSGNALKLVPLD